MQFADIEVGRLYGIRDKQYSFGGPVSKVKVIAKLGDKKRSKVRYTEGEREGLEEFLPSRQFLGRWTDVRAILRDEERMESLRTISKCEFHPVVWEAMWFVTEAMGDNDIVGVSSLGAPRLEVRADAASRIEQRFGLEPLRESHPEAFVDRAGTLHIPYPAAEEVVKKMAEKEPQAVLLYVQGEEDELRARGYEPGHRSAHEVLRKWQPMFALARQWAGLRGEAELLTKEIERLRGIVSQSIWTLKQTGAESEARRLERALYGQ